MTSRKAIVPVMQGISSIGRALKRSYGSLQEYERQLLLTDNSFKADTSVSPPPPSPKRERKFTQV